MMLHITNGTSVRIDQTGLPGEVLAWVDVLHEGPAPSGLTLEQMTEVRARFIAEAGWGSDRDVKAELAARDARLMDFRRHEEIVLWFEHDLYDQLQLIQILDWFASRDRGQTRLRLICIGEFPGKIRFGGLGELNGDELLSLFPTRHAVTEAELKLAVDAWSAFCSDDPSRIETLLAGDTSALPFLRRAFERHLEQFPCKRTGLSRSERQILEILATGIESFPAAFSAAANREESAWIGDTVFRSYIERMQDGKAPLVEGSPRNLRLTQTGREVLLGRSDAIALNGIDRWVGGVHLSGPEAQWRWNPDGRRLVRMESGADRR